MDDLDIQIYEEDIAENAYLIKAFQQKISDSLMTKFDEPNNARVDVLVAKLNQKVSQLKTKNRKLKTIVKEWYKQQND